MDKSHDTDLGSGPRPEDSRMCRFLDDLGDAAHEAMTAIIGDAVSPAGMVRPVMIEAVIGESGRSRSGLAAPEVDPANVARLVELPETRKDVDAQLAIGIEKVHHHPVLANESVFDPPEVE